jgi:serine/threonine protein kinase
MMLEGLQLGRYHLQHLLGIGRLSEVYQAEDVLIGQQVAIKFLHAEDTSHAHGYEDGVASHVFLRQAMAIANLDHPHILPLYNYGEINVEDSSFFYLVMPLCPDGTLAKWLERLGRSVQLSPLEVAHFVRQAASALQHAHDHHIIHQDVKPSNFLLRLGREHPDLPDLLLADFGNAEFIPATTTNFANRTIRATPAYMAPEQWEGYPERATDQFALGVIAYQMLTAHLPFPAPLEQDVSFHTQPQRPGMLNPNLSTELDEIVLCALARRPRDRFPSIAAFAQAFQLAAQSIDTSTVTNTSNAPGSKEITATLAISEAEAIQGTNRTLVLTGGRRISISIPPGIQNGQVIRLEGQFQLNSKSKQTDTLILTIAVSHVEDDEPTLHSDSNELTFQSGFPVKLGIPAVVNRPRPRNFSWMRKVMSLALAILIVVVTVELFLLAQQNRGRGVNTAAPSAALADVTNPYTHNGKLELDDPLSDNRHGHSWQENANTGGAACRFAGGAYHAVQQQKGYVQTCFAKSTDFGNFVYEVQLTVVTGDYGGIIFCADSANLKFYYFSIGRDGRFYFSRYVDGNPAHAQVLLQGQAPFIHTGFNQVNLLAVVVQNGSIDLYVNQQKIGSYDDSSYTHGQIGVFAGNAGNSTDIAFSNVRVWQL